MDQETNVAPVEATQIPSTEPSETTEVAPQEAEQTETTEAPKDDADKTVKRLERRINQKHAQAAAAEERARMIEAQLNEARQKLSQYEAPQETQQQPDPFKLAEAIATVREVNAKANKVAAEGKTRFPDFSQALQEVAQEVGPLFGQGGLPTPVGEAILDSDDPAALLHHLGTNPDVAADLRGLSPVQVARRIARIEADMSKPREPKVSNAPKPIAPVKSGKTDTTGLSDDLPLDEWHRRFTQLRRGK
jgi:hypothetical protein